MNQDIMEFVVYMIYARVNKWNLLLKQVYNQERIEDMEGFVYGKI